MRFSTLYSYPAVSNCLIITKNLNFRNVRKLFQNTLDEGTDPWGVKVERVEVKDVRIPKEMQRAMAAEAESTREARAKV